VKVIIAFGARPPVVVVQLWIVRWLSAMPTIIPATNYGVVRFIPVESFQNPTRGLDQDAQVDLILNRLSADGPRPQSIGDWPRIHHAVRRRDLFVVETSTPTFTALLRFSAESLDAGDYQIHYYGRVDTGRIVQVTAVKADDMDSRVSMLKPFAERFRVDTVGSERPHAMMVWLVGLSSYSIRWWLLVLFILGFAALFVWIVW